MTGEPLKLKRSIIYGPVNSRRLGASLGINLLPHRYKACPFNCAYCQYGFTPPEGFKVDSDGQDMPAPGDVAAALKEALVEYPAVSFITFSGNGEPTLHPAFAEIAMAIKEVKNAINPEIKLAILSNSALTYKAEVRHGLELLDARFMKLDAGDENTLRRFNHPHERISLQMIISGLRQLEDIIIQALFAGGASGNYNDYAIAGWIEKIAQIKPRECHIYSLDRPPADPGLLPIGIEDLTRIKRAAEKQTGIPVRVF